MRRIDPQVHQACCRRWTSASSRRSTRTNLGAKHSRRAIMPLAGGRRVSSCKVAGKGPSGGWPFVPRPGPAMPRPSPAAGARRGWPSAPGSTGTRAAPPGTRGSPGRPGRGTIAPSSKPFASGRGLPCAAVISGSRPEGRSSKRGQPSIRAIESRTKDGGGPRRAAGTRPASEASASGGRHGERSRLACREVAATEPSYPAPPTLVVGMSLVQEA